MWTTGTLLRLQREMGAYMRPRRDLDGPLLCLVICGHQRSFGTKGATNEYLLLGGEVLMTMVVNDAVETSWRVEVLKEG